MHLVRVWLGCCTSDDSPGRLLRRVIIDSTMNFVVDRVYSGVPAAVVRHAEHLHAHGSSGNLLRKELFVMCAIQSRPRYVIFVLFERCVMLPTANGLPKLPPVLDATFLRSRAMVPVTT